MKLLAIAAAIATACLTAACNTREHNEGDDLHGAWAYAQIYVENKIGAAGKVDFEYGAVANGSVTHIGNDEYDVKSYAVAPNEYGAKKRVPFHVHVYRLDDGRRWRVEEAGRG